MAPEPERLRVRARLSLGSSEALDACAPPGLPAECTRTRGISCSLEAAQVCWRRGSHWSSFRALWRSRLRQDPAVRHLAGNIQQSSGLREFYSKCCNSLDSHPQSSALRCLQLLLSAQQPFEHGGLHGGAVYICTGSLLPSLRRRSNPSHAPQSPSSSMYSCSQNVAIPLSASVSSLKSANFPVSTALTRSRTSSSRTSLECALLAFGGSLMHL